MTSDPLAVVAARRSGHGLAGAAYRDDGLYALELERIWRRSWCFVGHASELASAGERLCVEIAGDPLVVIRQPDGSLRALQNVCRHRGSLVVCDERQSGRRLVCPYHQWTYGLDGRLLRAPGAAAELDPETLGLLEAGCLEVGGLVFVRPAGDAPDGASMLAAFAEHVGAQGLAGVKVAHAATWRVPANWKLVWENNRECAHCVANHPQYVRANDDVRPAAGTPTDSLGLYAFPDASGERWWSANRTDLAEGYLSESLDGSRVAPLLDPAVPAGTLRLRTLPNFWCHASVDHAVTTRLLPLGPTTTEVKVSWLVASGAVEGRDYDLATLLPFWQLTSEQDWLICDRQQRGLSSSAFVPGPYSPHSEGNVERFLAWHASRLAASIPPPASAASGPRATTLAPR